LIGFVRSVHTDANANPQWAGFYGCGGTANGINCADAVLFYAPMVGGPKAADSGSTYTLYFGTSRLYRSADRGTTMTDVSGILPGSARVSAIGISPQDDNVRLVGTSTGKVYYSNTSGAVTMTDISTGIPARYVGRVAISPTDPNTAYVALNGFGIANQHVMKSTNLNAATPTWSNAGAGIPDVPTNALVIDPTDPKTIYAGTDIGVFQSTDAGATWNPFSTGLPRVAVFDIAIQPTSRILRIATHGRGIWEISLLAPTAAGVSVSGRVLTSDGRGLVNARVTIADSNGAVRTVITSPFGYYRFDDVQSGGTYVMEVVSKRFKFASRVVSVTDNLADVDFTAGTTAPASKIKPGSGGINGGPARDMGRVTISTLTLSCTNAVPKWATGILAPAADCGAVSAKDPDLIR
jgi:hypothetical protein